MKIALSCVRWSLVYIFLVKKNLIAPNNCIFYAFNKKIMFPAGGVVLYMIYIINKLAFISFWTHDMLHFYSILSENKFLTTFENFSGTDWNYVRLHVTKYINMHIEYV